MGDCRITRPAFPQTDQIFAITDDIVERARKIRGSALRSIGDIARHRRLEDNERESVAPQKMLRFLRAARELFAGFKDVATASLIEVWIDQAERRAWFLSEIVSEL
jgi:starvation-inducible DNA-binding protein